eukprot:Skav207533  [mRNA]  locus=scaffold756:106700:107599:- [translate_table: standard]
MKDALLLVHADSSACRTRPSDTDLIFSAGPCSHRSTKRNLWAMFAPAGSDCHLAGETPIKEPQRGDTAVLCPTELLCLYALPLLLMLRQWDLPTVHIRMATRSASGTENDIESIRVGDLALNEAGDGIEGAPLSAERSKEETCKSRGLARPGPKASQPKELRVLPEQTAARSMAERVTMQSLAQRKMTLKASEFWTWLRISKIAFKAPLFQLMVSEAKPKPLRARRELGISTEIHRNIGRANILENTRSMVLHESNLVVTRLDPSAMTPPKGLGATRGELQRHSCPVRNQPLYLSKLQP